MAEKEYAKQEILSIMLEVDYELRLKN